MILTQLFETALRDKADLQAKRKTLQDLSANKDVDQKAVQQRKLDLEQEAAKKGIQESYDDEEDYEDEDEDLRLHSGDYVRDTQDGESGEIFRMQGDPEERRVRILDRDGKGWYIEPSRLTRVDPQDPDVQRYFGKQRQRDMDEMDKSQPSQERHGDRALGAKGTTATPVAARKVVKDLALDLDQAFAKQKPVKKKGVAEESRGSATRRGQQDYAKGLTQQQNPYYKSQQGQTPPEAYDWEAGWEHARDAGKEPGVAEGWSDAMLSRRTGQPRTPYTVYIKGRKWKDFENDDHARAVMDKLKAKFKSDGRDPETITIAPTNMSEEEQKPGFGQFPPKQEITIVSPKKLKSGETYQDRNKYWQSQNQPPIYKTNEDHAAQTKKVFKDKSGKPVGEIGIDPESSPGNGEWYVYHYTTGYSVVGFDSAAEAKRELLYVHKHPDAVEGHPSTTEQGVTEGDIGQLEKDIADAPVEPIANMEEAKSLKKRVRIVKGSETGKTGTVGEVRHGAFKGAPKTFTVDIDGGGSVQLPKEALRLIKQSDMAEQTEKTATGLRHRAQPGVYGGADPEPDPLRTLDKPGTNKIEKALGVKFDREKKYQGGIALKEQSSPVENAILHRIMMAHPDVLAKYGPAAVMAAADDVADFVGDVDEIGTSDVSGWVKQTIQQLDRDRQVDEVSKDTLARYVKLAGQDVAGRASASSYQSGAAGDKYNKADPSRQEVSRERGIDRAITRLTR